MRYPASGQTGNSIFDMAAAATCLLLIVAGYPAYENTTLNHLLRLYLCQRQKDIRLTVKQEEAISTWQQLYAPTNDRGRISGVVKPYIKVYKTIVHQLLSKSREYLPNFSLTVLPLYL